MTSEEYTEEPSLHGLLEQYHIMNSDKEYLEECPYLHNINKAQSEWAQIWENFCPRGGSVSYFVPDNGETK